MKKFKLFYKCLNCSFEFAEEYESGDRITEHWNGITLESHECTHDIGCKFCRMIECPNCESKEDIKIIERKVI